MLSPVRPTRASPTTVRWSCSTAKSTRPCTTTAGFAHPNDYNPRYFLVNGQPYVSGAARHPGRQRQPATLVRMLNAALEDVVPTLLGMPWQLVAEDGNPYPYPETSTRPCCRP